MLQLQHQSKFVTKILTTETGETYRVVFLVALVNGEIKAQIVNAELISPVSSSSVKTDSPELICLPCDNADKTISSKTDAYDFHLDFSFLNKLDFFISQPTRAPSL